MASLSFCVEQQVKAGALTLEEANKILETQQMFAKQFANIKNISAEAAQRQADKKVINNAQENIVKKKRQAALQTIATYNAEKNMNKNERGLYEGLKSLLAKEAMRAGVSNVDYRGNAILGEFHRMFAKGMEGMRVKNAGWTQDVELIRNVAREAYGTKTGNARAAKIAKEWSEVSEYARIRFNRAGGNIPKLKDWGMPQHHDPIKVNKAAKTLKLESIDNRSAWKQYITPLLNRNRTFNEAGVPMNDQEFDEMLDIVFDTVRTNGATDLIKEPGKFRGRSSVANRHQDHRILAFNTADDWLNYQDTFGSQDLYHTMTDHLNMMSREIAQMEILGPNPDATFRLLKDKIAIKSGFKSQMQETYIDSLWNVVSGKADAAQNVRMADISSGTRHLLVSAQLGGATLSAASDVAFTSITARYNGFSATRTIQRQMSLMNPNNAEDRLLAVQMGLTADAWVSRAHGANRFVEISGAGLTAKISDRLLRASLLSSWTDAGRKAFGMEFMAYISKQSKFADTLNELDRPLREAFEGYGITPDDYKILRTTETINHKGVEFFSIENFMNRADLDINKKVDLSTKIQEMILTETDFAVPVPDAKVRVITTAGAKRGTILGEIARNVGLFKSFPITIITTHLMRRVRQTTLEKKARYLGALAVSTTLFGALALQAKDLQKGKTPRNMKTADFWQAAFIQGGGAGIFGDFLYSGLKGKNRFGQSIPESMMGPVYGLGKDTINLAVSIMEPSSVPKEAARYLGKYTPFNNLWYARLAFERTMGDFLKTVTDPNAKGTFKRQIKKTKTEYENTFWLEPGAFFK